ncbi:MAG TPA: patatin-like phospholipase family protein, partial [Deltaproteobacteria bacterium]|nr:patatin-like phospholipase family protein [Deltaproteobacteria bacterium]
RVVLLLMVVVMPLGAYAEERPARPKIGLALSGGGARGAAHVGVLKVLEEKGVPIDYIAGTSMGAIVGGLYASGVPLHELEHLITQTDWEGIFSDKIPRQRENYRGKSDRRNYLTSLELDLRKGVSLPKGLIRGKRIDLLLRSMTLNAPEDFDAFPIPYRAVATDIATGEMVVLDHGDLARAMRASMAIPGAFAPVEIDGRLLVDGGVSQNLPVEVVKGMGADVVIAVNIGTPLTKREDLESFLSIVDQVTNILTNRNVAAELKKVGPDDILIEPDLGEVGTASFDKLEEAVKSGTLAARRLEDRLKGLSVDQAEYQAIRDAQRGRLKPLGAIEFVRMEQKSWLGSEFIIKLIDRSAKGVLKKDILAYDMFDFYRRGDFEDIDFALVEEGGRQGLLIKQKEKTRPRHVISLGMELESNLDNDHTYQILMKYSASPLNRLGAKWKSELLFGQRQRFLAEFYQPLNPYPWKVFLAPSGAYRSYPVHVYTERKSENADAEYKVHDAWGGMDLGLQMGEYGELRWGYVNGRNRTRLKIGQESEITSEEKETYGAYRVQLNLDQLDNAFFPRQGWLFTAGYEYGRDNLGADRNYRHAESSLVKALTHQRHTVALRGRWGTNLGSADAVPRRFSLGGFLNLSGMNADQVCGNHAVLGELVRGTCFAGALA